MDDDTGLTPPDPDAEGVRIIGADEAAEAVERGEVASRRGQDEPRFGDRPPQAPAQPKGPRPTLRFPLPDAEVADVARPKVKPPAPPPQDDRPRSLFSVGPDTGGTPDGPAGWEGYDDEGEEMPEDRTDDMTDDHGAGHGVEGGSGGGDDAASVRIPHWTEPATGEVPAVLVGDRADDDAWAAFSDGGPRWRDDARDYDERDDLASLDDSEARMGALDPDAPGEHELLAFDDLAAPAPRKKKAAGPRPVGSGAPSKKKARPPSPGGPGGPGGPGRPGRPGSGPDSRRPGGPGPTGRPPGAGRPGGPTGGDRDLPTAMAVGAILALGALGLLWAGPGWMMILVTAVVLFSAAELFTTTRRAGYVPAQLLGIVVCVVLPLAAFWKGTLAYPVVLGLTAMCGFIWYIVGAGEERPVMNLGVTALGILWIGMLSSFAGLLLAVPGQGASLMLSVLLVAVAHDVGGFFVGRSFGRAPLTSISPGKTVEGLAGAVVASVAMAVVVVNLVGIGPFGENVGRALALGVVVGVATAVGDLCESVVKRDLGVKDMGNVLPGHGGVLDRMDGILFALPAAWYLGLYLGVVGT